MHKPSEYPEIPDISELTQLVNTEKPLDEHPACDILCRQVNKIFQYLKDKKPSATKEELIFETARIYNNKNTYARVTDMSPQDFESFDNRRELTKKLPVIIRAIKQVYQEIEKRGNSKPLYEEGWLYAMRGNKGETAYRIYLSPETEKAADIFNALEMEMPQSTDFQMKMIDPVTGLQACRMEKIIIYSDLQNIEDIWQAIAEVHNRFADAFKNRPTPAGGIQVPGMPGLSFAKQPVAKDGKKKTATEEVADRIDEKIKQQLLPYHAYRFRSKFGKNAFAVSQSPEGQFLISALRDYFSLIKFYLGEDKLTDSEQDQLRQIYANVLYGHIVIALCHGTFTLSTSKLKTDFINAIKQSRLHLKKSHWAVITKENVTNLIPVGGYIKRVLETVFKKTYLALEMYDSINSGKEPGDAIRRMLH